MRLRDLHRDRIVWLFALVVLAMFYRPLATETFYFRDLYQVFYPKKLVLADAIRSGIFPLWDPMTNGGRPYLATPTNYALHPTNLLYAVLPAILAFNLVLVMHVLFCAVAAYWLARLVGLRTASAAVTGIAFAFCGYTLSTASLMLLMLGLPWIPMTIGLTHRALRDGRSIVPAAIAAVMPLYGAAVELAGMLIITLVCWVVWARTRRSLRSRVLALCIVGAFGVGLSLVQTLTAVSVIAQSKRSEMRTYESFTSWSVSPKRLPELVIPRFFGSTSTLSEEGYWGRRNETHGFPYILSLYLGIPLLLLAVTGSLLRSKQVDAPPAVLAVLAAAGVLLSLGSNLPAFRLIYDYIPVLTIFRYPVKAQVLSLLPVALLAGCGVQLIAESLRARRTAMIGALTCMAVTAVACVATMTSPDFIGWLSHAFAFEQLTPTNFTLLKKSFAHTAIAASAIALVIVFWKRAGRYAPAIVAAVVMLDLVVSGYEVNDYAPRSIYDPSPLSEAVDRIGAPGRFYSATTSDMVRAPADELQWLARWEIATLSGYSASIFGIPVIFHSDDDGLAPVRVVNLSNAVSRLSWNDRRAVLDRAAVRTFLSREPVELPGVMQVADVDVMGVRYRLYFNSQAVPVRFVSSAVTASSGQEALRRMVSAPTLDHAVLEEPRGGLGNCGSGAVTLVQRELNSARYEMDAPCDGLVVFAEPHYEGWTATVNGEPATHQRADYAFTAIPVRAGKNVIERRYWPPLLGVALAGVALAGVLLVPVGRWWARRGPSRHE